MADPGSGFFSTKTGSISGYNLGKLINNPENARGFRGSN